eukprot:gene15947-18960_t
MKWVDPLKTRWSCIDAHGGNDELSTPGGDAGEFLLHLGQLKNKINPDQVEGLLNGFLKSDRTSFYMHTNSRAEKNLLLSLQSKYGKHRYPDTFDIEHPLPSQHAEILKEVIKPENVGCDHIQFLLQQPADYGVPLSLTQAFIQSYFRGLWSDISRTNFEYRRHDYQHGNAVNMNARDSNVIIVKISDKFVNQRDQCRGLLPTLTPSTDLASSIVMTGQNEVMSGVRGRLYRYFANAVGMSESDLNQLNALASKQSALTLAKIAHNVPVCQLRLTKYSTSQIIQDASGHFNTPVDPDMISN